MGAKRKHAPIGIRSMGEVQNIPYSPATVTLAYPRLPVTSFSTVSILCILTCPLSSLWISCGFVCHVTSACGVPKRLLSWLECSQQDSKSPND